VLDLCRLDQSLALNADCFRDVRIFREQLFLQVVPWPGVEAHRKPITAWRRLALAPKPRLGSANFGRCVGLVAVPRRSLSRLSFRFFVGPFAVPAYRSGGTRLRPCNFSMHSKNQARTRDSMQPSDHGAIRCESEVLELLKRWTLLRGLRSGKQKA